MRSAMMAAAMAAMLVMMTGCDDSGSPATRPAASTQERVKQDVNEAGQQLKEAGDEVARKADPAIERAKEESKQAVHRAAEKVSELTAPTQP